jgi:hypothetical protein
MKGDSRFTTGDKGELNHDEPQKPEVQVLMI